MKKAAYILILILLILSASGLNPVPVGATSILIPGDTPEEAGINRQILEDTDEVSVAAYLTNEAASVRETACKRLGDIGSPWSLDALLSVVINGSEDHNIRNVASFSIWKIRYRGEISPGENFLLSVIDIYQTTALNKTVDFEAGPVPFTPRADGGQWVVESGVYKQITAGDDTHLSFLNDPINEDGIIEVKVKFNALSDKMLLCFRVDGTGDNGYAVAAYCYYDSIQNPNNCFISIYELKDGQIEWGSNLGNAIVKNIDINYRHTIRVELSGASININMDGLSALSAVSDDTCRGTKVGLGTACLANPIWFDDLYIQSSKTIRDDSDATKTPEVIGWAAGLLGDMGSQAAIPLLQKIISDTQITPYSSYLKEAANEAAVKIDFITDTPEGDLIPQGLINPALCIREWALNKLVEQDPPGLIARLEALFETAQQNGDDEFASAIATVLDEQREKNRYPALEIEYPNDQEIIKTPSCEVYGYTYGEPFREEINLVPGANTYTKTITDRKGNEVSQSITIYFQNEPPVLNPIGNKQVHMGQALTFSISASDPDDTDLLYYTCPYPLPGGMNFDYDTHTFTYMPTPADIGIHQINFKVDDGYGLTDSETIIITVNPADYVTYYPSGRIEWQGFAEANEYGFVDCHYMDRDGMIMDKAILAVRDQYGAIAYEWEYLGLGTQDLVIDRNENLAGGVLNLRSLTINAGCMLTIEDNAWLYTTNDPVLNGALCVYGDYTCGAIRGTNVSMGGAAPPASFENGYLYVVGEGRTLTTSLVQTNTVHVGAGQRLVIASDTSLLPPGSVATPSPATPTVFKKMYYNNVDFAPQHLIRTDILFNPSSSLSAAAMPSSPASLSITPRAIAPVAPVPPSLEAIPNKAVDENQLLEFRVSGSSPVNKALTYSARNLPKGASFANQAFSWIPAPGQAKVYRVIFTVTDGSLSASKVATITVNRADKPPVLNPIGDKAVDEDKPLQFIVQATDPDNDPLIYSAKELPQGAEFKQIESLLGTLYQFTWTPVSGQAGTYPVTFTVSDGKLTTSETITITVNKVIVPQAVISEKPRVLDVAAEPVSETPPPVVIPETPEEPKPAEALPDIEPQAVIQEELVVPNVVIPEEPAVLNVETEPVNVTPQPVVIPEVTKDLKPAVLNTQATSPVMISVPYFTGVTPEIMISGNTEVKRPDALSLSIMADQADGLEISGLPGNAEKTIREENGCFYADITYKTEEAKEFDIDISATRGIFKTDRSIHVRIN